MFFKQKGARKEFDHGRQEVSLHAAEGFGVKRRKQDGAGGRFVELSDKSIIRAFLPFLYVNIYYFSTHDTFL